LIIIALFSALGGIFSTFIGYLGNMINSLLFIPFGGGQIIAGLHTFWIVFIYLLARRKAGTALLVGTVKGFIEFFSGSAHGIIVVILSGSQGLIIEIFVILFLASENKRVLSIAAGLATSSNVLIQQIIFFNSQIPFYFIGIMLLISFISGFIFGGFLPIYIYDLFEESSMLNWRKPPHEVISQKNIKILRLAIIIIIILSEVTVFSFLIVRNQHSAQVTGSVYNPYTFYPIDFIGQFKTVEAELRGDVSYFPPKNYTGVPLSVIIARGQPIPQAYNVRISASDGYYAFFNSTTIDNDQTIILTSTEIGLRVIAGNFHGSYWVHKVNRIEIIQ
jgi:energy-coupling factor transport system substrate-specific component